MNSESMTSATDLADASNILRPYSVPSYWRRHRRQGLWLLGFIAFFYGAAFAFTSTYFLLQLSLPLIALLLLIVWLLPETGKTPTRSLGWLFNAFLIALLCWPDYLALALPGLPWITAMRLVTVPLAIVFMVGLSQSVTFRRELMDIVSAVPAIWKLMVAFTVIALLSIGFSAVPSMSISKFVVALLYWVLIFFVSAYVFTQPGRVAKFAYFIWLIAIFVCLIGLQEARHNAVPWAGHIPSFLKVEDESVQRILAGVSRSATGIYRVQSRFSTPLGLAEYLAYAMPFVLHIGLTTPRAWTRFAAMITIPLILYIIIKTDSRLGMVGFFMTFLLYLLAWGVLRWRRQAMSLFGPATVIAYPVVFASFIISTFFIGRLRAMVWGTGAQSASTESRKLQVATGLPKIFSHPWGHGFGRGAETLGFTNQAGVLTIDSYYLLVALDVGILGFLVFYGMFGIAIWKAATAMLKQFDRDTSFIVPLTIALANFVIIKSIFSQIENHPLIFAMLGAIVALVWRMQKNQAATETKI